MIFHLQLSFSLSLLCLSHVPKVAQAVKKNPFFNSKRESTHTHTHTITAMIHPVLNCMNQRSNMQVAVMASGHSVGFMKSIHAEENRIVRPL